jgi:hypothetical protein
MMTQLEDLRLALRQICQAIGLSRTAATVVSLVVLGVALNIAALSAMEHLRNERHPGHGPIALRSAARTELKVVRTVLASTLKRIGDGRRGWCVAQQWVMDRQAEFSEYQVEVGYVWAAPSGSEGCDVNIAGSSNRKTAIALVQC